MKFRTFFFVFIKITVFTQEKKDSVLDAISMNFIECIDPGLFDIAFAGILSQKMETLKSHEYH